MSVEAAPKVLIWKNDTTSSKKGRKVSHLRNVSTIHSVRKSRRLAEKRRRRREEEYHGYSQEEPRPKFENEHKSTPHLNPRGAEFESIRLATRIEEWCRNRAAEEELTELPAQKKGILRISDTERTVQPLYLYDPEKDDTDLHFDQMIYEPRRRSMWGPRPYSLKEIVYDYETEDEEQRDCERESQDHYYDHHTHPFAHNKSTWTTEAGGDTFTPIQEMRESTHSGNLDSNSRKATGQRTTTTSDQDRHLSETKPIENGTRRLTLDQTP
jgi:hypothetical protein